MGGDKKKSSGGKGRGAATQGRLMNSSWGFESTRNLDKTHLSNPMIAPSGSSPTAAAVPISHTRSRRRASFENPGFSSLSRSEESEEEKTMRYNNASRNGSSNFGVGYKETAEDAAAGGEQPRTGQDGAQPASLPTPAPTPAPAHEESIYKVMSHNFGRAKEQIIRNDSSATVGGNLEAAYMAKRDAEEVESLRTKGKMTAKSRRNHFSGEDALTFTLTGQVDWLHLISDEEHAENMRMLTDFDFAVWEYSQRELVGLAWSM